MHIVCNGLKIQVVQLGPDFLMLEEADDFEGPAQVILSVDGETQRRDVQLQCGPTRNEKQSRSCTNCVRSPPICKKLDNYP